MRGSVLRYTLGFIGVVQLILGLVFLFIPAQFAALVGLSVVPAWVPWMFAMFSARAFGFAYGMFVAMREPEAHRTWIVSMIIVQAVDWIVTVHFLLQGVVTLPQVSTASFLPIIFIGVLVARFPRRNAQTLASAS
ncbi:MAG: hypothetical protein H0X30_18775 [Anaerolineae bacterium]|nr:hypothetical protein [Anaerolineae bacterium]